MGGIESPDLSRLPCKPVREPFQTISTPFRCLKTPANFIDDHGILMEIREFWKIFASMWTLSISFCNDLSVTGAETVDSGLNSGFPCAIRCKDQHMQQMRHIIGDASEWSLDFLMPLQTILRQSANVTSAVNSIGYACKINYEYGDCLSHCPKNEASSVLMLGIKPWSYICRWSDKQDFGSSVLPCWWSRIHEIHSYCGQDLKRLRDVVGAVGGSVDTDKNKKKYFQSLCTSFSSVKTYDACHLTAVRGWCPFSVLIEFLMGLNRETNDTLLALSQYAAIRSTLPRECLDWNIDESLHKPAPPAQDKVMGIAIPINGRSRATTATPTGWCSILMSIMIISTMYLGYY